MKIIIMNGPPSCVDEDTEFFNGKEWKKIKDYSLGEEILTYHPNGEATLECPSKYVESEGDVEFKKFSGLYCDMVLTDNHRVVYKTGKSGRIREKTAGEFHNILLENKWGFDGKIPNSFRFDADDYPISDDELRFIVAYCADGSKYKVGELSKISVKHEYKKKEVERLLNSCGYKYIKREYESMPGYTRYEFKTNIRKELPMFFYNLSIRQKIIVKDSLIFWDGDNSRTFRTTKESEKDLAQFIFSSIGLQTYVSEDNRVGEVYSKGYIRKSICYRVAFSGNKFDGFSMTKIKSDVYSKKGKCYCFTTSTGMWIARRGDKIFITGNSGKDECSLLMRKLFPASLHFSFKRKLISLTCMIYNVDRAIWDSWYTTQGKELPRKELNGLSCRQALIFVSEDVIKPKFGNDYFGVQECNLLSTVLEKDYTFAISSDGGFEEELRPIAEKFGVHNTHIIHLYRDGCSFKGDSRSYISPSFIPKENIHTVINNSSLEDLEANIKEKAELIRSR